MTCSPHNNTHTRAHTCINTPHMSAPLKPLQVAPGVSYYRKPFEFLSLGLLAYVGNDRALTQIEAFDSTVNLYGAFAFLLWRSVYITKQVRLCVGRVHGFIVVGTRVCSML